MELCIVCPKRIKDVFRHLIITFQYELDIKTTVYNIDEIFSLNNKRIILFGAQELCKYKEYQTLLLFNIVYLYNTEQLQSRAWDYMVYSSFKVKEWWDYSLVNIEFLKQNNLPLTIKHIYPCYSSILELPVKDTIDKTTITFFGTHHERRFYLCNKLQEVLGQEYTVKYNTSGNLYREVYDNYVCNNMIYLNLHYYQPSILEIVRIVPLLCQGHLVISERSDDCHLNRIFEPYVIWLEDIIDNPVLLKEKINSHDNNKLKEKFKNELNFKNIFQVFDLI